LQQESEPSTIHASYEEQSPSSGIQIALLNVQDYPIVLNVRPEDATAVSLAKALGQSPEILKFTSVIGADPATRALSEQARQTIQLIAGSAVVFERGSVDRTRIPFALPKPFESEIAHGARSGLIGSPHGPSAELHHVGSSLSGGTFDGISVEQPQR